MTSGYWRQIWFDLTDRRPDHTVSGAPSPRFVLFVFWKVFICSCLSVPWQGSRHSSSRLSPLQDGVGVRRDRRESSGREPSCPPIAGDIRLRLWLSQARRLVAAPPGAPFAGDHATGSPLTQCPPARLWLNARRPASDSMPAGSPLTQARWIAADSCPPDRRWLKPTGLALIHARWPPLSLAPWIQSTRHGQECCVCLVVPTGTF